MNVSLTRGRKNKSNQIGELDWRGDSLGDHKGFQIEFLYTRKDR